MSTLHYIMCNKTACRLKLKQCHKPVKSTPQSHVLPTSSFLKFSSRCVMRFVSDTVICYADEPHRCGLHYYSLQLKSLHQVNSRDYDSNHSGISNVLSPGIIKKFYSNLAHAELSVWRFFAHQLENQPFFFSTHYRFDFFENHLR